MSGPEIKYDSVLERDVLDRLRVRFEALGYQFTPHPSADLTPPFLAGWRPDAIALRGSDRIAIEVIGERAIYSDKIRDLHLRFKDQTEWRLAVLTERSLGDLEPTTPVPPLGAVNEAIGKVEQLIAYEQAAPALIMSFSILEAVMKLVLELEGTKSFRPGSVIESLAMEGLINETDASRLRSLVELRNRLVHGDLGANVTAGDVQAVIGVVNKVLAGAYAV